MPCKTECHSEQLAAARLIGQTAEAKLRRAAGLRRAWQDKRESMIAGLNAMHTPENRRKAADARRRTAAERFEKYASPEPNTGCWLWSASCDIRGYGQLRVDGRLRFASHIALELDGRPRPSPDHVARHSCDFPPCVNPDHLEWGTRKDNTQDAVKRGRLDMSGLALGRGRG